MSDIIINNVNEINEMQAKDAWVEYDGLTEEEMTNLLRKVIEKQLAKEEQSGLCPEEFADGQDDGGIIPLNGGMDDDKFNQLVELQSRMSKGMEEFIIPTQKKKDNKVLIYQNYKDAFQKGKDALTKYSEKYGNTKGFPYWNRFNELKAKRDESYLAMKEVQDQLSKYWDLWKNLQGQVKELVGDEKALWGKFFGEYQIPDTFLKKVGDHSFYMVSGEKLDTEAMDNQEDNEDYLLWVGFDSEEIDDQNVYKMTQADQMEELLGSHLREEASYWSDLEGNPGNLWKLNEWLEDKKKNKSTQVADLSVSEYYSEMTVEEADSLMETCPF